MEVLAEGQGGYVGHRVCIHSQIGGTSPMAYGTVGGLELKYNNPTDNILEGDVQYSHHKTMTVT